MQGRARRQREIGERHEDRRDSEKREEARAERPDEAETRGTHRRHASTARPFRAKRPRGRFWMNRMMKTRSAILPRTAPAKGSRNLFAMPIDKAAIKVPQRLPTPPKTTTRNE